MTFVAGVDEAGRGPVIGPMVMAICACKDEATLKKRGVKDSKLLTPEQRTNLAIGLRSDEQNVKYEIISLSPLEIDAAVNGKSQNDNLNHLEARTTALLIYRLAKRVALSIVTVDSPTRTVAGYEREIRASLDKIDKEGVTKNILIRAEIKADYNHPVVGAASIFAKTTRDEAIAELAVKHGKIGSGYLTDPDTQAFLLAQWKEPHEFFRRSWESYQRLVRAVDQASLADFGVDNEKHKEIIKAFEQLFEHGYHFEPPTNQYEILRMKNEDVTIIRYSTGKVVVQGPELQKKDAEKLLAELHLITKE